MSQSFPAIRPDQARERARYRGRILLHNREHAKLTIDEGQTERGYPKRSYVWPGTLLGANLAFRLEVLLAIEGMDPELGAGTQFPCEDIDAVAAIRERIAIVRMVVRVHRAKADLFRTSRSHHMA